MEKRAWHQFYDQGVPASIDFEDAPVPAFLERSAAKYGDANALIFMNARLTYGQLKEEVDTYAAARMQTLDNGQPVSPYTVMRELGHRSLKLIEDNYGHLQQVRHRSSVVEYREATVTRIGEQRRA